MSLAELREDGHSGSSPPTKKRKVVGLECGLDNAQQQASIVSQSNERNGNGTTMAHNGNGVTSNGTENGSQKPIDEGLYSRQLFVLGKSVFQVFFFFSYHFHNAINQFQPGKLFYIASIFLYCFGLAN